MKNIITIIRIAIGWHFLYEGCIKLFADNWSAGSYLNNGYGFLSEFFQWLAASPGRLAVVDFLNVWGLILIGLALCIGLLARWASLAGALLLTLYYFAYPPFGFSLISNGNVYIINTLFIEAAILVFFFCNNEKGHGLDNLIQFLKKKKKTTPEPMSVPVDAATNINMRRELLKDLVALPVVGLLGWGASRRIKLYGTDALSGATIQLQQVALGELKGELPKGKLGPHEISRLVGGSNLINGFAHARDLVYANSLFKAYNTEKKIFETLMLCEQAGINCFNSGMNSIRLLAKYRKLTGSKMLVVAQAGSGQKDIYEHINLAIDLGIDIIQVHGGSCDNHVKNNELDVIEKMISHIRSQGLVAGLGAHAIDSLIICEENGIIPDYYMKTMHHDNYWSAHPREFREPFEVVSGNSRNRDRYHDNLFDTFPDRTIEFVNRVKVPVMGFKVLAAGSIRPKDGFRYAFENGCDFICVGMFDFQVVDDVNVCLDVLQNLQNRQRGWYS